MNATRNTQHAFHRLHTMRMENTAAGYAMDELRPRFERLANRKENGTAPRAVTAYQLFQTPPDLAGKMASMLDLSTLNPANSQLRILEPSAGLGALLDAVSLITHHSPLITAVELAANLCGELYQQNRPVVTILQRDFLACTPLVTCHSSPGAAVLGHFDRIIMNPPFHLRGDIKHILHARTFLKEGGKLVALCLDTPHRAAALRGLCETWEPIPAGTFKTAGTNVPTILLTMRGGENPKSFTRITPINTNKTHENQFQSPERAPDDSPGQRPGERTTNKPSICGPAARAARA